MKFLTNNDGTAPLFSIMSSASRFHNQDWFEGFQGKYFMGILPSGPVFLRKKKHLSYPPGSKASMADDV